MKHFLSRFRWYRHWVGGTWRLVSGGRGLLGGPWVYWINRDPVQTGYCSYEFVILEERYGKDGAA